MKKSERHFVVGIEPGGSAIIGIDEANTLWIALGHGKTYRAPIERIHAAMARWHAKEHPTGKRSRRLLTHSDQLRSKSK
jgi:hypothetical protein